MQKAKLQFKIQNYFIVAFLLVILPLEVFAAELYFGATAKETSLGAPAEIGVFLSSSERVNAFEGVIRFTPELFQALEVRDGNSFVPVWIERPQIKKEDPGRVSFSGLIPGGYSGRSAYLFSIIGVPKKEGMLTVSAENLKAYLNDGAGTVAPVQVAPLKLRVVASGSAVPAYSPPKDTAPPEEFMPEVVQISTEPFHGEWVLVFSTTDKGSGIDRYELREARPRVLAFLMPWQRVESPYVLKDQSRKSFLYLKAVDKAGNECIEIVYPQNWQPWYKNYLILGMLILAAIIAGVIVRKVLWRKFTPLERH